MMALPLERLGEVVAQRREPIQIDDFREYKRVKVRLHQQGVELRDVIVGGDLRTKTQQVCRAGDLIFAEIDAKVGGYGVIPDDLDGAIVSSHYFLFTIDEDRVERRFLELALKNPGFQDQIIARGSTNYAAIRAEQVLELRVPLPDRIQQRRVVAFLDNVFALQARVQVLNTRAALLAAALLPATVKQLFNSGIRRGWPLRPLAEGLVEMRYGTSQAASPEPIGTPVLRMGNIQSGALDTSDLKYIDLGDSERRRLLLRRGDILVNRTNSAELVGKCAVFDRNDEYVFASYIIRLRVDPDRLDPYFVAYYINSPVGRRYMFDNRKQMTGQANINSKTLSALPLPFAPLSEQRQAVERINEIRAQAAAARQLAARMTNILAALRVSLIRERLNGAL